MGGSSANGGGFQSRRRGSKRYAPMADMNVTPLVDVMLVLLIVFMVTAPLMTTGVPIDLPKTEAKALGGDKEPLTIVVDKKGAIFIQDKEIAPKNLVAKLKAISKNGYNERIYVRGDTSTSYGAVIKVMGKISGAGFSRIGLVTQQEEGG